MGKGGIKRGGILKGIREQAVFWLYIIPEPEAK